MGAGSQFNFPRSLSMSLRTPSSSPSLNELKNHILKLMFKESDEQKPVTVSQEKNDFKLLVSDFKQFFINSKHVSKHCGLHAVT